MSVGNPVRDDGSMRRIRVHVSIQRIWFVKHGCETRYVNWFQGSILVIE